MANYVYGAKTVCPFYLKEAKMSITCEGLADGTTLMTRFASREEKRRYQAANCEMYNYANCCPLAAALMRKYDEYEAPAPPREHTRISIEQRKKPKEKPVKTAGSGQLYWIWED